MSLGTTMSSQPVSIQLDNPNMASIAKRQRFQDVLFHRITQSFSLLVLVALMGIIVSLFIFFNTFAFNQAFQYKKIGPWKNYLFGEATYITLSLVAKSILAWQVFSGAIIPAIVG